MPTSREKFIEVKGLYDFIDYKIALVKKINFNIPI